MTKNDALERAVNVAKAYGQGGYTGLPENVIEKVYRKLVELIKDVQSGAATNRVPEPED